MDNKFKLTKEMFVETIRVIQNEIEKTEEINKILGTFDDNSTIFPSSSLNQLIELLKHVLSDNDPMVSNIEWFIECDFGRNQDMNFISYENGETIAIDTPEKLYDLILECQG